MLPASDNRGRLSWQVQCHTGVPLDRPCEFLLLIRQSLLRRVCRRIHLETNSRCYSVNVSLMYLGPLSCSHGYQGIGANLRSQQRIAQDASAHHNVPRLGIFTLQHIFMVSDALIFWGICPWRSGIKQSSGFHWSGADQKGGDCHGNGRRS